MDSDLVLRLVVNSDESTVMTMVLKRVSLWGAG
jgi:hypothetical protein